MVRLPSMGRPADSVDALLQSWAERRPDLDFTPVGIVSRLARVRGHLSAELDRVYARHGLTAPTFAVLVTLARIDDGSGVSQRRLMDELGLTSGTVSVRMDRLSEEGLVDRDPDPASKRTTRIRLTEQGRALFERVVPEHLATERRLLAGLSMEEADTLAGLLRKLLVELEGSEPTAEARARLGLTVAPAHVAMELRASVGLEPVPALLVRDVADGGPGASAGLRAGDVLVEADGYPLHGIASLYEALDDAAESRQVTLLVLRGADQRAVTLQLAGDERIDGSLAASTGRGPRGYHVV
jgi:DNA-binding MarR family transcriptional regulator